MSATIAEFVGATHTKAPHGTMKPTVSIGIASAKSIAECLDPERMADIAAAAREYLPQVYAELAELRAARDAHPAKLARRIFLFGISTPNRSEDQSIAYAVAAEPFLGILSAEDVARMAYPSPINGGDCVLGMPTQIERSIADGMALLGDRFGIWDIAYPDTLERIRGIGPKVARMIAAIAIPEGYSWTVDLWHARQLLWAAGLDPAVRISVDRGAYHTLEQEWLAYAGRHFPNETIFAVQWATWCAANGEFVSHRALWADLADKG